MRFLPEKYLPLPPRFWVVACSAVGCAIIAILVTVAAHPKIQTQIVMRRAWFNQSLRHYDLAFKDLNSIRSEMLTDSRWQEQMFAVLSASKNWKQMGLIALDLHEKEAATPEWLWNGWKALLRIGWDTRARRIAELLHEPYVLERLGSGRAEFIKAMEQYEKGDQPGAQQTIARARRHGVEPALLLCLEAQWLTEAGQWKKAEELLLKITPDDLEGLARFELAMAAVWLAKGQTVSGLGTLDLYLSKGGIATRLTDRHLNAVARAAARPYDEWASQTLRVWRTCREIANEAEYGPPDWSQADYPFLTGGNMVARISPESLRGPGNRRLDPHLPQQVFEAQGSITLPYSGNYTIVLRGAANRYGHKGAMTVVQFPGQWAAVTYFASRIPEERRFTVNLRKGATTLTLAAMPGWGPQKVRNGFWLHEALVLESQQSLAAEDSGWRDFLIFSWKDWAEGKASSVSAANEQGSPHPESLTSGRLAQGTPILIGSEGNGVSR